MSYTTPPITTTTNYGAIESYSALQSAPALLTRFTPPTQCSTDWFWDTGALRSSSTVFSNAAHNSQWNTCQPYNETAATYSAGVCPQKSEFKSVTQVSWDGVSESYYMGACCASTAEYQEYQSGEATGLYGCVATLTQSLVVATWVQQNEEQTAVTSQGPVTVIADPLFMVWHESDTSMHPVSDANSLRAAMGMAIVTGTATTASTSAPTTTLTPTASVASEATTRLSGGAIAGIVVGFVACFIAIGALAYFACLRRRRKPEHSSEQTRAVERPESANAWSNEEVYGRGALQLQTSMQNTIHKAPSFVDVHGVDSAGSRTPQTPYTPRMLDRAKEEDTYAVEQKMLLR